MRRFPAFLVAAGLVLSVAGAALISAALGVLALGIALVLVGYDIGSDE